MKNERATSSNMKTQLKMIETTVGRASVICRGTYVPLSATVARGFGRSGPFNCDAAIELTKMMESSEEKKQSI